MRRCWLAIAGLPLRSKARISARTVDLKDRSLRLLKYTNGRRAILWKSWRRASWSGSTTETFQQGRRKSCLSQFWPFLQYQIIN
jgi:hypothetical protein